jgi:signal transduction histidine kinase
MPDKLLVVEDDLNILYSLREILTISGYSVQTARNGADGLDALRRGYEPALILSDIDMPRMNGYEFFDQVRANAQWINIPFVFLSAQADRSDIRRGKALGADDYLTKPFDTEDLLVTIKSKIRRHAQLEAAHDQQMASLKTTILATLSHEFRTPLTYISTYAEMVKDKDLSSEEFKSFMQGVRSGSERLQKLVEDFIFLVELQTGEAQQLFEKRKVKFAMLPLLLQKAIADYLGLAATKQVQLVEAFPAELPAVWVDRDYVLNAVKRLLDNAIKFSKPGGGTVTMLAQVTNGQVLIQVKDEGIGLKPSELARVFDVFVQIDRAKMQQQGSGSGLAIANGIARMHGGALTATSAEGVGSVFTMSLPVAG